MNKFQQGGVFNPITVNTPDVGGINASPIIDIPIPPAFNLPDMANLAIDAERRRRLADQDAARQQGQLDSARKEFYSLQDELVGEVHNPYQKAVLEKAKAKYGIDDDFYSSVNTSDYFQLRNETDKIYKFMKDPEVLAVIGEVEYANKLMDKLPPGMTQEEWDQFNKYRTETYMNADSKDKYDIRLLDPRAYKRPAVKANKVPNFASTVSSVLGPIAGQIDITDPNERQRIHSILADSWAAQDGPGAVEAGLIVMPPNGGLPTLTPLGERIADERTAAYANTYMVKRQDKIEDATTMAQTRDAIGDANRAEAAKGKANAKGKTSPVKGATPDQYDAAWNVFVAENPSFDGVDPYDPEVAAVFGKLVVNGKINTSPKIRQAAAQLMETLPEVQVIRAQRIGEDTARRLNPDAPATTTPAPGTQVVPQDTTKGRTFEDIK